MKNEGRSIGALWFLGRVQPWIDLDVGRMHDHTEQQPLRVDRNMALAPLDLLGGIVAARPPFSVVFTLWLSMMAAVGLASRPSPSRNRTTRWWRMLSQTPAARNARK